MQMRSTFISIGALNDFGGQLDSEIPVCRIASASSSTKGTYVELGPSRSTGKLPFTSRRLVRSSEGIQALTRQMQ